MRTGVCSGLALATVGFVAGGAQAQTPNDSFTETAYTAFDRQPGTIGGRLEHAAAFHPSWFGADSGSVLVFGGIADTLAGAVVQELWQWDVDGFDLVTTAGVLPPARHGHAMVYADGYGLVVFGGATDLIGTLVDDTWIWADPTTPDFVMPPLTSGAPSARFGHGMAVEPTAGTPMVFGGATTAPTPAPTDVLGDLWELTIEANGDATWTERVQISAPAARYDHAMYVDGVLAQVVVAGGTAADGSTLDDIRSFDPATGSWVSRGTLPVPLARHAIAYDAAARRVILFGGRSPSPTHVPPLSVWEGRLGSDRRYVWTETTDAPGGGRVTLAQLPDSSDLVAVGMSDGVLLQGGVDVPGVASARAVIVRAERHRVRGIENSPIVVGKEGSASIALQYAKVTGSIETDVTSTWTATDGGSVANATADFDTFGVAENTLTAGEEERIYAFDVIVTVRGKDLLSLTYELEVVRDPDIPDGGGATDGGERAPPSLYGCPGSGGWLVLLIPFAFVGRKRAGLLGAMLMLVSGVARAGVEPSVLPAVEDAVTQRPDPASPLDDSAKDEAPEEDSGTDETEPTKSSGEEKPAGEAAAEAVEEPPAEEVATEAVEEKAAGEVETEALEEKPAEEVATEGVEEKPAEEVATEGVEEKPAEEVATEAVEEKPAEEVAAEAAEEKPAEEVTTEAVEEQPAEEVTTEVVEEKPAEEVATEAVEEQPAEEVTTEAVEAKPAGEVTTEAVEETPAGEVAIVEPEDRPAPAPVPEGFLASSTLRFVARTDVELLHGGIVLGGGVRLERARYAAQVLVFPRPWKARSDAPSRPIGLRAELRGQPFTFGAVTPYVAVGLTAFFPSVTARVGGGAQMSFEKLVLTIDLSYESLLNDSGRFSPSYLLGGIGLGFEL